jgi:hypothetical protein
MDLKGAWLKDENMPAVLKCCHVSIERLPVVTYDDCAALGRKFAWDGMLFKAPCVGVPGDDFLDFGLDLPPDVEPVLKLVLSLTEHQPASFAEA